MKYLKKFEVASEYDAFKNSDDFILPNVSWIVASDTVMYGISKTEEGDYKVLLMSKKDISGLTYNAVDLGLTSGRLWADKNVGAANPDDYGTYFAWGETTGFTYEGAKNITAEQLCSILQPMIGNEITLTPDNIDAILAEIGIEGTDLTITSITFTSEKAFSSDWSDYFDTTDGGNTFNKYTTDTLTVIEASDDAASVNMGSDWRLPTIEEVEELADNTVITYIDNNGVEHLNDGDIFDYFLNNCQTPGFKLTIKLTGTNGNYILIPLSSSFSDGCGSFYAASVNLWTSLLNIYYKNHPGSYDNIDAHAHMWGLTISEDISTPTTPRHAGICVRGVK